MHLVDVQSSERIGFAVVCQTQIARITDTFFQAWARQTGEAFSHVDYTQYFTKWLRSEYDFFKRVQVGAALSLALQLDTDANLKQAIESAFSDIANLRDAINACKTIAIALAISARYGVLATALSKKTLDIGEIDRLINELDRDKQPSTSASTANRLWLLVSATKVAVAVNPISLQHAFWRYAVCLADLCIQHLSPHDRQFFRHIHFTLKLLEARVEGKLEPWEGIVLVRQV